MGAIGKKLKVLLSLPVLAMSMGSMVQNAMRPKEPFQAQIPPIAPVYENAEAWSALPERLDSADQAPPTDAGMDQHSALVDVFYVHPTSYVGDHWNAPTDDPKLNLATDTVATGIQASAFNRCCAVYAPRYRQANGIPFIDPSSDGDLAVDIAYSDIKRAFQAFNARRGQGRPFILAAHSQGSVLVERLIYEEITGTPLRDLMVAAYLPGGTLTVPVLAAKAPDIAVCDHPEQLHCVVAWNARHEGYTPSDYELVLPGQPRVCVNPLSWKNDDVWMPASANMGAVFLETKDPSVRPEFADAQCREGTLWIKEMDKAPRNWISRILDRVMGKGNLHPVEYQIFFMNIRQNAALRVQQMLEKL